MKKIHLHFLKGCVCVAFLAMMLLGNITGHAQVITTVAGNGTATNTGDGGLATAATLQPSGVVCDKKGNIYVSSGTGHIRKIDNTGIITTIAGNGTKTSVSGDGGAATAAAIGTPTSIVIDAAGNIYFLAKAVVNNGSMIRKIDAAGIITFVAGGNGLISSGDGGAATAAALGTAVGLALDTAGNIYIATNGIRKIDKAGIITTLAGSGTAINGVVYDTSGYLYATFGVGSSSNDFNGVLKINIATKKIDTIAGARPQGFGGDGGLAIGATLNHPTGITIDPYGNIVFIDISNNRIRSINKGGIITTLAGNGIKAEAGDGGLATAASLNNPFAITTDTTGNIYIAESVGNRLRKIAAPPSCKNLHAGIVTVSGDTSFCVTGADTLLLTGADTGYGFTHQWQSSTNGANWANVGTDTAIYITGTIADTMYYRNFTTCSTTGATALTQAKVINVSPMVTPTAGISTSVPNSICPNTLVAFISSIVNGGSAPQYQWQKNGTIVGTGTSYTDSSFANNDTVIFTVTTNATCAIQPTATDTIVMSVNPTIVPKATIVASPGNTVSAGTMVTFTATVTDGGSNPTYQWRKNDTDISSATSSFYATNKLANNDRINCWVHGNSNAPCIDTAAFLSDTITMHISTGISEIHTADAINIYPNPNNGQFNLTGATNKDEVLNIAIIDITGRVMQEQTINTQHGQFSTAINAKNICADGLYMLRITCDAGNQLIPFSISK